MNTNFKNCSKLMLKKNLKHKKEVSQMSAVKERIIQMKSGHVRKTSINALQSLSISLPVKSDTQACYMLPGLS